MKNRKDGVGNEIDPIGRYFVQDTRSVVGNCALWWGPDSAGYVCDLREAGVYTGAETKGMRDTDLPWPVEAVQPFVVHHVRVDSVHGLLGLRRNSTPGEMKAKESAR